MATKIWGSDGNIEWDDVSEGWTAGPGGRLWPAGDGYGRIGFDNAGDDSYYYGPVIDTGRLANYIIISDTPNPAGYTIEMRGSLTSFNATDSTPIWEAYTTPVNRDWRYIQLRITYFFFLWVDESGFDWEDEGGFVWAEN